MKWIKILMRFGIAFGCIMLGIAIVMDKVVMPKYVHHGEELTLPDITGKNLDEVRDIFNSLGLKLIKHEEKIDPNVARGTVLLQNPRAHSTVKKGRRVYVTISIPEKPIQVPYLIGLSRRDAEIIVKETGLILDSLLSSYYSHRPEGTVGDQSISSGTMVPRGTNIKITISKGPEPTEVIIPDLYGMHLDAARQELDKIGLSIQQIIPYPQNNKMPNTVIGQEPERGTAVPVNGAVKLVVSTTDSSSNKSIFLPD